MIFKANSLNSLVLNPLGSELKLVMSVEYFLLIIISVKRFHLKIGHSVFVSEGQRLANICSALSTLNLSVFSSEYGILYREEEHVKYDYLSTNSY